MKKEEYDYLSHSASTTDCTGLIPTPAVSEAERESYDAIYPYMPKETEENKRKR